MTGLEATAKWIEEFRDMNGDPSVNEILAHIGMAIESESGNPAIPKRTTTPPPAPPPPRETNNKRAFHVSWFKTINGLIGIVVMDKKAYIKSVAGLNEDEDVKDIIENGGKVLVSQLERTLKYLKS